MALYNTPCINIFIYSHIPLYKKYITNSEGMSVGEENSIPVILSVYIIQCVCREESISISISKKFINIKKEV